MSKKIDKTLSEIKNREKPYITLIKIVSFSISLIIISINLIFFVSKIFGFTPVAVTDNSMSPALNNGDLVISQEVANGNSLKLGDVAVFRNDDDTISFRRIKDVVMPEGKSLEYKMRTPNKTGEIAFVTKADSLENVDPFYRPFSTIENQEIFYIPFVGFATNVAYSVYGGIIFIMSSLLFVFIRFADPSYQERRRIKRSFQH